MGLWKCSICVEIYKIRGYMLIKLLFIIILLTPGTVLCSPIDNISPNNTNIHKFKYINYTEIIRNWITTIHIDWNNEVFFEVLSVDDVGTMNKVPMTGDRIFTVKIYYQFDTIEYALTIDSSGNVTKYKTYVEVFPKYFNNIDCSVEDADKIHCSEA